MPLLVPVCRKEAFPPTASRFLSSQSLTQVEFRLCRGKGAVGQKDQQRRPCRHKYRLRRYAGAVDRTDQQRRQVYLKKLLDITRQDPFGFLYTIFYSLLVREPRTKASETSPTPRKSFTGLREDSPYSRITRSFLGYFTSYCKSNAVCC